MKTTRKFKTMILFFIMTATTVHASQKENIVSMGIDMEATSFTHVDNMSTEQLQKEVERFSQRGEVSLALGMELMKRWSKS